MELSKRKCRRYSLIFKSDRIHLKRLRSIWNQVWLKVAKSKLILSHCTCSIRFFIKSETWLSCAHLKYKVTHRSVSTIKLSTSKQWKAYLLITGLKYNNCAKNGGTAHKKTIQPLPWLWITNRKLCKSMLVWTQKNKKIPSTKTMKDPFAWDNLLSSRAWWLVLLPSSLCFLESLIKMSRIYYHPNSKPKMTST